MNNPRDEKEFFQEVKEEINKITNSLALKYQDEDPSEGGKIIYAIISGLYIHSMLNVIESNSQEYMVDTFYKACKEAIEKHNKNAENRT